MLRKIQIANVIFFLIVFLIVSPWIFEKKFLFNELLSAIGIVLLIYKQGRISKDIISLMVLFLLGWGAIHMFFSIFRADAIYYYLRNLVIIYSIFTYFIGYYLYRYLGTFIKLFRQAFKLYVSFLLLFPISRFLFERFSMSTIFPVLLNRISNFFLLPALILINIIYSISYESSTSFVLALFYLFLMITPGYRFFKQFSLVFFVFFLIVFIYLLPNLELINNNNNQQSAIHQVINSHYLLSVDGNSTWRLVLWKQILIDNFPSNIFGLGFGTPLIKYFPIEDYSKVHTLPYVLGAHNSFVYLTGRLGFLYLVITIFIYREIFKEYFYFKSFFYRHRTIAVFWSFFSITIIALFNPTLESPVYAGIYWFLLGILARVINERKVKKGNKFYENEDSVYP